MISGPGMAHVAYTHIAIQAVIESVWIFLVNARECSLVDNF
jgi:hypothetical protein